MADKCLIEPDLSFIKQVVGLGGDTLKKCFQCATCSVVCPIAPENKPFPRKEMIAASWGLKDKLIGSMDIWLCHNCGDCTTMCPRGAKPGDVLGAVRSYAISEYAVPKFIGKAVNDPKKLPVLLGLPVVVFLVLGFITGLLDFTPGGDKIVHSNFFSSWLVDLIFVPLAAWVAVVFGIGLKRFVNDMHENAVLEGKTDKKKLEIGGLIRGLFSVIPTILKHSKFSECGENKDRATAHLMVFYSFIGLFIVTNIFFVVLYVFQIHGPYSQMNPVKWLANVSGIALIIGSALMIKNRMAKTDQVTSYKDWYLLILVLGLGVTGMLTEMTRLAGIAGLSYALYFIHLMFVFHLFIFLPFSKLAHLVYRTVAMAYGEYGKR
ncbi:MAG: quinone-interacting membrane-bound oxidoreductase complex subunit QmoC [Desulfobacterales bacterium]|uniref:Quinone-interacting membrane-bound oxidoreductase complex subunit QmoC n=1 Tax=Candidatus Desulfaltia bathyphila TaxID=2841697 RepID=A0A8J6T5W4_9BACT|nr:quinone-interacting membrane-bound oxidoreductase complex subunit QmoC [Candidatus Desulfaltia bathyphila]MBL7195881.1 quinone-interacting membrane-bound oxidoreductase complex subunit QmoC [Desulfobacterales bacterium]MBL7207240.1 quinone-interacting membrane-bound oxidoreductase complex subunit QmoC [Desulfobacterales bacterium]